MCGSGTILIEAALLALNIPPQYKRQRFSFMKWPDFDEALFELIRDSCIKKIRDVQVNIVGYDNHPAMVKIAKENVAYADLEDYIQIVKHDFFNAEPHEGKAFLLFNPPYGERIKIQEKDFYKKIGNTLKQNYTGSEAWLITSDFSGLKNVGLRSSKKIALKNGSLDCKLVCFELYEGSKKASKQDNIANK